MPRTAVRFSLAVSFTIGCHPQPTTFSEERPALVGTGVISTNAPEFAFTVSRDGRVAYFNRASDDRRRLTIMQSRWNGTSWEPATVAPFSGQHADVDPHLTPDGRFLLFSSDRPRENGRRAGFDHWVVPFEARESTPAKLLEPLNSDSSDIYITQSRDGTTVFSSTRAGTARVFASRYQRGRWQPPVPLEFGGDSTGGNPAISPDGAMIVLVRAVPDRGADLFVSCRSQAGWSAAKALNAANSPFADFAPSFDANGRTLFFTSERPGVVGPQPPGARPPGDIYAIAVGRWCSGGSI